MDTVTMDEIGNRGWQAPATSDRGRDGAWIGAAIAGVAALAGAAFGTPYLALGIPAAAIAGWFIGRRIRADGGIVGPAVAMAVLTVVVADTLVVGGLVATSLAGGGSTGTTIPDVVGGSIVLWCAGLIVAGIPALVVTIPCGLIWVVVARRQARSAASRPT